MRFSHDGRDRSLVAGGDLVVVDHVIGALYGFIAAVIYCVGPLVGGRYGKLVEFPPVGFVAGRVCRYIVAADHCSVCGRVYKPVTPLVGQTLVSSCQSRFETVLGRQYVVSVQEPGGIFFEVVIAPCSEENQGGQYDQVIFFHDNQEFMFCAPVRGRDFFKYFPVRNSG